MAIYRMPSKTVLLTRPELEEQAVQLFVSTSVVIRSCGSSYLCGALGEEEFRITSTYDIVFAYGMLEI